VREAAWSSKISRPLPGTSSTSPVHDAGDRRRARPTVGLAGVLRAAGPREFYWTLSPGAAPSLLSPFAMRSLDTDSPTCSPPAIPPRCHRRPAAGQRLQTCPLWSAERAAPESGGDLGTLHSSASPPTSTQPPVTRPRARPSSIRWQPLQTNPEHQGTYRCQDTRLSEPRTSHPRPADKQRFQTRDASDQRLAPGVRRGRGAAQAESCRPGSDIPYRRAEASFTAREGARRRSAGPCSAPQCGRADTTLTLAANASGVCGGERVVSGCWAGWW
jgi:hypothetical protein